MGRRALIAVLLLAFGTVAVAGPADKEAEARRQLDAVRYKMAVEFAGAHIELGIWCRDAGLVPQATAEFLRAAEVGGSAAPRALKIVAIMRALDDKFWKTVQKHPKQLLDTYEKRAKKLELDLLKAKLRNAKEATKLGLPEEAYAEYAALVRQTNEPLTLDPAGKIVLPIGTLPLDVSERIRKDAVTINDRSYLRDDFLLLIPTVSEVSEVTSERVRVRTEGALAEAADLHAMVTALLLPLEDETDGRPTRRIQVFVFKTRASYGAWLDAASLSQHKVATGVADGATFTALVCAEGLPLDTVRGVALHEVSHLFMFGVTPVVMPSWYSEGFAETFGGPGTYAWNGTSLVAGGLLAEGSLARIRTEEGYLPWSSVFQGDALKLLQADKSQALGFYAEAWAIRHWFTEQAPADVKARFRQWEVACRGGALGAEPGRPRDRNTAPAAEAFQRAFGPDLPALEAQFRAWLSGAKAR